MNKTILITGASSGIGKATAIHFQKKGWNVLATMRSPEKETELNTLENIRLEKLDVLDLESIKKAVQNGILKFGKIDALVNNAGYGAYGPLESFPRENIIKQFSTNVIGCNTSNHSSLQAKQRWSYGQYFFHWRANDVCFGCPLSRN